MMGLKSHLRKILQYLHLDLTKNLSYDRQTNLILSRTLNDTSNCIDIGAHKGEVLEKIIQYAPNGKHFAIEPIPSLCEELTKKFAGQAKILQLAISDKLGTTNFQYVRNAPAYSGIRKRRYAIDNPDIEQLTVTTSTLSQVIPPELEIDLIKIDVEGGEYEVLLGASALIEAQRPIIIFECGKGGIDFYGHAPGDIFQYFNHLNYEVYTLASWLEKDAALSENELITFFETGQEYYFIGAPSAN